MNRKRIGKIAVLFAVFVLSLAFTACQDTAERVAIFTNSSATKIQVLCPGSEPSTFILEKLPSQASPDVPTQTVTRKGKDIEYTWSLPEYSTQDRDNIVEAEQTSTGLNFKGKQGGILSYKIDEVPLDK
jgi:hypothetical protein